jgi:hypothetical protein
MSNIFAENIIGSGAEGGTADSPYGLYGVFRTLADEHQQIAKQLLASTLAPTLGKRAELWYEVRRQLLAHEQAEDEIVYADFEMHAGLSDILGQHEDASAHLRRLVEKVDEPPLLSVEWEAAVKHLHAALKWHATREDDDFFPRAQAFISERRSEELKELFNEAKKTILETS